MDLGTDRVRNKLFVDVLLALRDGDLLRPSLAVPPG